MDIWEKDSYSIEEIVDGLVGNSNCKNDISYINILTKLVDKSIDFDSSLFLFIIEHGIIEDLLYRIYEICNKDENEFFRVLCHIKKVGVNKGFRKEEIITNASLDKPVEFIDKSIMLLNGENPEEKFSPDFGQIYDVSRILEDAYCQDIKASLIRRINARIKETNNDLPLLPEIKTYEQDQNELINEINSSKIPDDYSINVNNLFFGKYTSEVSGEIISLSSSLVSWFENMNMRIGNYFVFRSVPSGDYCLIDESGKIYIPSKPVEANGISILPTSPIKYVDISSVKHILEESTKKLDPIEDEKILLGIKGLLELIDNNVTITVAELENYEPIIRSCYEMLFGKMFEKGDVSPKL